MPPWLTNVLAGVGVLTVIPGVWKVWEWANNFRLERRKDQREQAAADRDAVDWLNSKLREVAQLATQEYDKEKHRADAAEAAAARLELDLTTLPVVLAVLQAALGRHVVERWRTHLDTEFEQLRQLLVRAAGLTQADFDELAALRDDVRRDERLRQLPIEQREQAIAALAAFQGARAFLSIARGITVDVTIAYGAPLFLLQVDVDAENFRPSALSALAPYRPAVSEFDDRGFSPEQILDDTETYLRKLLAEHKAKSKA